jgi:AraC-type DNA-binding domain-containing proteins
LRPGSRDMLGRLMEMLFVEMLRRYIARLPPETAGWLGALNEPVVGRALQVIHTKPLEDWTVESLALTVGTSRSVLAERFKATLGQPPMQYLSAWRLQLAMNMLREKRRSIAEIAAEVGYESEAAFNRAFKRHLGLPPGAWREQAVVARL